MTEDAANQLLEYCERCQASLDRIEELLDDLIARQTPVISELTFT